MQIKIEIDDSCHEPQLTIRASQVTDEIKEILNRFSEDRPHMITGFQEDCVKILEEQEIFRVYAENGKTAADTEQGKFFLRLRLYEAEERLDKKNFVRISNSEIINLRKVKSFDLSFSGTICVSLVNGTVTYVSRRYVAKIKQVLGI